MRSGSLPNRACRAAAAGSAEDDRRLVCLEPTDRGEATARAVSQVVTRFLRARVLTPLGRDGLSRLARAMSALRDADDAPGK